MLKPTDKELDLAILIKKTFQSLAKEDITIAEYLMVLASLLNCVARQCPAAERSAMLAQYKAMAAKIVAGWEDAWTPVTESLPDDEIKVLTYAEQYDDPVFLAYHEAGDWYDAETGFRLNPETYLVTHWRPLPAPPSV